MKSKLDWGNLLSFLSILVGMLCILFLQDDVHCSLYTQYTNNYHPYAGNIMLPNTHAAHYEIKTKDRSIDLSFCSYMLIITTQYAEMH